MELSFFSAKEIIVILASYALGSINVGYYLVRFCTGQDIRGIGSGNAGSSNVARALGVPGFVGTFIGDSAKGAMATGAALYFELSSWGVVLPMIAVVAGHIWPVHLGFRGGKGLATFLGVVLVFDRWLLLVVLIIAMIILALLRLRTTSVLVPIALAPGIAAIMGRPLEDLLGISVIALLVVFAHRTNIQDDIAALRGVSGGRG